MLNPRRLVLAGLLVPVFVLVAAHVYIYVLTRPIVLPEYEPVDVRFSEQNWTADERQWYYHETQGGAFELIIPFDWLIAFEQPRIPLFLFGEVGRLMDEDYISRFGFLPNPRRSYNPENVDIDWATLPGRPTVLLDTINNPYELPVGFARDRDYRWPTYTDEPQDVVGFTCAACHTAQLNYEKDGVRYGVRVDGGPALTNLTKFELAAGIAAGLTLKIPSRFNRFADRVLPSGYSDEDRAQLKEKLSALVDEGQQLKKSVDKGGYYDVMDGFGRIDALDRIGNFVFAEENNGVNWFDGDAPVNYPPLWDTPWFDWVQYNGAIKRPMVRNAGEAMGVFARAYMTGAENDDQLFRSTVRLDNLHEMESLLRGKEPFDGLRSPKWPEQIFGSIDRAKAARGAELYARHCQSCHLPAPVEGSPFFDKSNRTVWTAPDSVTGLQYLNLNLVNVYEVGTDPTLVKNFSGRIVNVGAVGQKFRDSLGVGKGGMLLYGDALPFIVENVVRKGYDDLGLSDSLRFVWNGMRPNDIRSPLAYKARPLDGVWATAPYLHNGSVPTLYQMISPLEERDATFYLGSKDFDPKEVGFKRGRIRGGFKLDTSIPGNLNTGHQFDGDFDPETVDWDTVPSGTIGPRLSVEDRWAIVEFLKTL
ncbi:MAG: cytochrome c [Rhodothermales bacterium]